MGLGLRPAARELGISHVALLKAEKSGRVQREADGTYDVENCRRSLAENSNPEQSRRARTQQRKSAVIAGAGKKIEEVKPSEDSLAEALRQQAWIKVERDRQEARVRAGELVELAPVNAFIAGMILKAKEQLTKIAPELRDQLAQQPDPVVCESLIADRIEQILRGFAEYHPPKTKTKK